MTDRPELRVRFRERDIWLPPGRYLIGRSGACHIVVDDRLVSRRHAEIRVRPDGASIKDAGSINGVYVDGVRVGDEPEALRAGSRVVIGNEVLEIQMGVVPSSRERLDTLAGGEAVVPAPSDDEEPTIRTFHSLAPPTRPDDPAGTPAPGGQSSVTQRADALEMFAPFAAQAIALGRSEEAERLLGVHLRSLLAGVRAGTFPKRETLDRAVDLGLELALSGRAPWFDFVVELQDALRSPPRSLAVVERLEKAARVAHPVNVDKLTHWTRTLRQRIASLDVEDLERLDRLETLLGSLIRGRRR